MATEVVYSLDSIETDNSAVRSSLAAAQRYLTDASGASLQLTSSQFSEVRDLVFSASDDGYISNNDIARLNAAEFEALHSDVRASTLAIQQEVRAIGSLVEACHADTVAKLNTIQAGIQQVSDNVTLLGNNIEVVANNLVQLRRDFNTYVEADVRANNVQRAETKLIQLHQQLDSNFGQNRELRGMAEGVLQANDLNVRTETILTTAEELCIKTPRYWLAPALVALSSWITASRAVAGGRAASDREVLMNVDTMKRTLNEAYLRECSKTALFFGLVCRRANNISQANEWFADYLSFQNPRNVDHTCIVLLNAYAGGLMGHGAEEQAMLHTMSDWLHELMSDTDGKYAAAVVNDWKSKCRDLYARAEPSATTYQALPEFCSTTWPEMQASMQATNLHREFKNFLEEEMSAKDFAEDDLTLIDGMIKDLVTEFDADELPIRREQEYQQLIVDLEGNVNLAKALRGIKDDILSETKSFSSLLSDAARYSDLSHASAATHVYAIRIQMPWIKKAYEEATKEYRDATPKTITLNVGDFTATTTDGTNEEEVVKAFIAHVNEQERAALEASKTGLVQLIALIAGGIAAALGLILGLIQGGSWWLLFIIGIIAAGYGFLAGKKARNAQAEIKKDMENKRNYGVLVIRKVMAEVRAWRSEYATNEAVMKDVLAGMETMTVDLADGAFSDAR